MKIEKNGKIYAVKEEKTSWALSLRIGAVSVKYSVGKSDCATFEELQAFVANNSVFQEIII